MGAKRLASLGHEAYEKYVSRRGVNTANRAHEELFVASPVGIRDPGCEGRWGRRRRMSLATGSRPSSLTRYRANCRECERRMPMRGETKLVSALIFVGAVLMGACANPYHEGNERYVFVATNIN